MVGQVYRPEKIRLTIKAYKIKIQDFNNIKQTFKFALRLDADEKKISFLYNYTQPEMFVFDEKNSNIGDKKPAGENLLLTRKNISGKKREGLAEFVVKDQDKNEHSITVKIQSQLTPSGMKVVLTLNSDLALDISQGEQPGIY